MSIIPKGNKPKQKTCKNKKCKNKFTPLNGLIGWCSPSCGYEYSQQLKEKKEKKVKTENRVALREFNNRDTKKLTLLAKKLVQEYARVRDALEPCISCRKPTAKQWDGGHYMSAEYHSLIRFNPLNIHKQCSHCNDWNNENKAAYRINLIKKIGLDQVEWLEQQTGVKKWSIEELQSIIKEYRAKVKELLNA